MYSLARFIFVSIAAFCLSICSGFAASAQDNKARLVFVFDRSCRISCEQVKPLLSEIANEYKSKLQVIELDISADTKTQTQKRAEELGLKKFLADTEDWYPAVGIFDEHGKKIKELLGSQSKAKYVAAIEKALASKQK